MKKMFVLVILLLVGLQVQAMQQPDVVENVDGGRYQILPEAQAIEVRDELSVFSEENRTLLQNYSAEMITSALSALAQDVDYQALLSSQENSAANSSSNYQRAEQECMVKLLAKLVQQKKSENDGRREESRRCGLKEWLTCGLPSTAAIMGIVLGVAGFITSMARTPECPR